MNSCFPILIFRHKKTGKVYQYLFEAIAEATVERVIVYKCLGDGSIWTRPKTEFEERFEQVGQVNK